MASFNKSRKRSLSETRYGQKEPPYSRLFVLCSKTLTANDFQDAFSRFGEILDIWVVKNPRTRESKGVVYIKFKKTSEAAAALEAMDGAFIGNASKPIKVVVASSRTEGSTRDDNEEEKLLRLFVIIPKTMTENQLYDAFKMYGDIKYANVVMDRARNESKGFGYIKFRTFSQAAIAFEQCDHKYRAVFAEPRKPRHSEFQDNSSDNNYNESSRTITMPDSKDDFKTLEVISSPTLNESQIWKLFDIIPGMDFCQSQLEADSRSEYLVSTVVYSRAQAASYAVEKFHGFEYPIGCQLIVKPKYTAYGFGETSIDPYNDRWVEHYNGREHYDVKREDYDWRQEREIVPRGAGARNSNFVHLAHTIAKPTDMIKAARFSPSEYLPRNDFDSDELHCSVQLPAPKPMLSSDTVIGARCFIVCSYPLPPNILRNVFCRFGYLIDVYLLPKRNCGYAVYASRRSANTAMQTLHGAEVDGVRLKVLEAKEPEDIKRMRFNNYE